MPSKNNISEIIERGGLRKGFKAFEALLVLITTEVAINLACIMANSVYRNNDEKPPSREEKRIIEGWKQKMRDKGKKKVWQIRADTLMFSLSDD